METPLFKLATPREAMPSFGSRSSGSFANGVTSMPLGRGSNSRSWMSRWDPLRGQARPAVPRWTRAACRCWVNWNDGHPDGPAGATRRRCRWRDRGHLRLQRDQRGGSRVRRHALGGRPRGRARAAPPTRPARREDRRGRRQAPGSASSGTLKGVKPKSLQIFSRQFATMIEAGMNVVVVARRSSRSRRATRCSRQVIGAAPRGRRGRPPALGGDGAPPEGVQPSLRRDGRGGRGRRHPRHRARPRRAADREGAEDQAAREGRDGLPDDRADLRDARPERDAAVPRPDLRRRSSPSSNGQLPTLTQYVCRCRTRSAATGSSSSRSSAG